jgi:hypothetical protein
MDQIIKWIIAFDERERINKRKCLIDIFVGSGITFSLSQSGEYI